MKNKPTDIRIAMDKSIFKDRKFTSQDKQEIIEKIKRKKKRTEWLPRSLSVAFTIILVVSVAYLVREELNDSNEIAESPQGNGEVILPDNNSEPSQLPDLTTPPSLAEKTDKELFELNSLEEQAYNNFQKDLDLRYLAGLEPLSVAKLYIIASYNQNFGVEYALYTDRKDRIQWSKEENDNIPVSDRATKKQILTQFKNFETGVFIKTSDYEGYIEFEVDIESEVKSGFKMIQNEDGIWQVAFMPIQ